MIKVSELKVESYDADNISHVNVALVADTKEEVLAIGSDGSTVIGLSTGDVMTLGSTCLCVNGDFGILDSSGTWTF